MNVGLTTFKDNILIHGNEAEIFHNDLIQTTEEYDIALDCAIKYLKAEGFLEDKNADGVWVPHILEHIYIIDPSGKQIIREECL